MNKLRKEHDKIAKLFLTDKDIAHKFLSLYLPPEVLSKCNLSTMCIEPETYIEETLKSRASDIVYKINLYDTSDTDSIYLYVLIEHQAKADKLMPLRVIRYQLAIIEKHLDKTKGNELKLPLVVPLVLYNGKKSPYPYSCDIRELFADKHLYEKITLGKFDLIDLTIKPDDELLHHGKLSILEIVTKHIHDRDFIKTVDSVIKALIIAHDKNINQTLINGIFSYLIYAKEKKEIIYLLDKIKKRIPFYERNAMSYAEELLQEGQEQAQQQIIKNMFNDGLSSEQIAKYAGISLDKLEKIFTTNISNV